MSLGAHEVLPDDVIARIPDYVIRAFCFLLWHVAQLLACLPLFLFFLNGSLSVLSTRSPARSSIVEHVNTQMM